MADSLYELLTPYFDQPTGGTRQLTTPLNDATTNNYLARLATLSLDALHTTEPASLSQASQSVLRSLQALSKRSHRSVIAATDHLSHLSSLLPELNAKSQELRDGLPSVETAATEFAKKYDRNAENTVLDRRKKAMLLSRNVDRVGDVLDLPTLLSTTISSSSSAATQGTGGVAASGYASALDLHAHVKRLRSLYPDSELVADIAKQADDEIQNLITVLITGLQNPGLKLAGAMRMIGWLRRVAPDLASHGSSSQSRMLNLNGATEEGSLGALFLVCRLSTLRRILEALEPLRDLADQETARRRDMTTKGERWMGGTQTERYLKRWIEVFREQSFNIVSMYKSIFPSALPVPGSVAEATSPRSTSPSVGGVASMAPFAGYAGQGALSEDEFNRIPPALATFALHLVDTLADVMTEYMPNVAERSSRDSLLTQVLYCARSLGRQGADFSMMLALMEDELQGEAVVDSQDQDELEPEWMQVMRKHRVQASRLELLASGVGSGRKGSTSTEARSPSPSTALAGA